MENLELLLTDIITVCITILAITLCLYLLFVILVKIYKIFMRLQVFREHQSGLLFKISLPRYRHNSDINPEKSDQIKSASAVAEQIFAELRGIIPTDLRKHLIYSETLSF